jgi:hypothetical protein
MSLPSSPAVMSGVRDALRCMSVPASGLSDGEFVPTWRGLYIMQCISSHAARIPSSGSPWWAQFLSGGFQAVVRILVAVTSRLNGLSSIDDSVCWDGVLTAALCLVKQCADKVRGLLCPMTLYA